MRKVIGKILIIVSLGCVALAFASLFLPLKVNFTVFDDPTEKDIIYGTGTVASLFTCLLCLPCKIICNLDAKYGGGQITDSYRMNNLGSRASLPGLIQFLVIAALIICAVIVLILLLANKFNGKKKVFLSILFLFFLVVTTASMLFETAIVDLNAKGNFEQEGIQYIRMKNIATAPICYMLCGAAALVINVVGLILIRGDKKTKVKANPANKNK
ncbi:MAG: hypothetical protein MJ207_00575 [Bacilli bacterium]|nr:hypothetical protein [Bacilli bacterium]